MISPKQVSAIIVTRGNVSLHEILSSLSLFAEVIVYDNSRRLFDWRPFGQYIAADHAKHDVIYSQDDDNLVSDPGAILKAWSPERIVCNMGAEYQRAYKNKRDKLMGFGSVWPRALVRPTFEQYLKHFPLDDVTLREPNRIFTALNHSRIDIVDIPIKHAEYASDPDRLWRQPDHGHMRDEALRRVEVVLGSL